MRPLNAGDANFTVTGYELRQYNDVIVLNGPANNLQRLAPTPCLGDANGDRVVNFSDVTAVLTSFGDAGQTPFTSGDVDGDGVVSFQDVTAVLAKLGYRCSQN